MSLEFIRSCFSVPAYAGVMVSCNGREGTIIRDFGTSLGVFFEDTQQIEPWNPVHNIEYMDFNRNFARYDFLPPGRTWEENRNLIIYAKDIEMAKCFAFEILKEIFEDEVDESKLEVRFSNG